jgi:hypothetical protein
MLARPWVIYRVDVFPSCKIKDFRKRFDAEDYCRILNMRSQFQYEVIFE